MLDEHRSEVVDLCITEYNEELHEKNLREEGRAEGREEGREEGRALAEAKILINMYKNGFTVEQIASATNKEVYEVKDIIQK
jgi:predicted transposase YdaD